MPLLRAGQTQRGGLVAVRRSRTSTFDFQLLRMITVPVRPRPSTTRYESARAPPARSLDCKAGLGTGLGIWV